MDTTLQNIHIPNSFQTPNSTVDLIMPLLNSIKLTLYPILSYGIRHIIGWRDRVACLEAHISLSNFESGIEGNDYVNGTGLSQSAIRNALPILAKANLLVPVGKADKDKGQLYRLSFMMQDGAVNWDYLKELSAKKSKQNTKRTEAARQALANLIESECTVGQDTPPVALSDKTPPPDSGYCRTRQWCTVGQRESNPRFKPT